MDAPTQISSVLGANSSHYGTQITESRSVTRNALGRDLRDRRHYNQSSIWARLKTESVKAAFVESCTEALHQDTDAVIAKEQLRLLAQHANGLGRCDERAMYGPLLQLFNFIRTHDTTHHQLTKANRFMSGKKLRCNLNSGQPSFPSTFPDFTGVGPDSAHDSSLYEDRAFLVEVKPKNSDGPYPHGYDQTGSTGAIGGSFSCGPTTNTDCGTGTDAGSITNNSDTNVPDILSQVADYARLHMSSRPFWLFSVVLLIFGSGFCVAIFDRSGVVISPQMDMWEDLDQFIRVVRSLSCGLSDVELGQDPTVKSCSPDFKCTNNLEPTIPAFFIDPIGTETISYASHINKTRPAHRWCTVGRPIWLSTSLLGRGTTVWPVRACSSDSPERLEGEVMVMKTYWCHRTRNPESGLYISLAQVLDYPATVARFRTGGDVQVASHDRPTISVDYLRRVFNKQDESPFMHRLVLASRGRPLWTYRSDLELVQGMAAAIRGHQWLFNQGLLHCDISPGNLMLYDHPDPNHGEKGFIADLDLAKPNERFEVYTEEVVTRRSGRVRQAGQSSGAITLITSSAARQGAPVTGTMQFMAVTILHGLVNNTPVAHTAESDLEACQCVMCYVVMRSILERTAHMDPKDTQRNDLKEIFKSAFGVASPRRLYRSRSAGEQFAFIHVNQLPFVLGYVARPIIDLLNVFRRRHIAKTNAFLFGDPMELLELMDHSAVLASFSVCEAALLQMH